MFLVPGAISATAAPPGPDVQVPEGGAAPGAFPNTSVTAANVIARGSTTFDGNVDVVGFDGQGPIPWSINRFNRGDIAMRLSPADPTAANAILNQGFTEFGDSSPTVAASHAWRPHPALGVVIPTSRQNGPIDWNDGEGPFYPTIALSESSSGPGYDMTTGAFGSGNLDINTGRAGTHASSPEANFSYSVAWFPYDQGWLGGEAAGPLVGDAVLPDGTSRWTQPNAHAAGLSAGLVQWPQFPAESGIYGGVAIVRLPGVNSLDDGMLFAASSDGSSDLNIVGVAPAEDGNGWHLAIREDSATDAETVAAPDQSEFQFVYIPFNATGLVGGHIVGSNGSKRKAAGEFSVSRTRAGTYELTLPGATGSSGALILQVADFEPGTTEPIATRAFLTYEFRDGKFVIESRVTSSDDTAELRDTSFYVAWIDFAQPLAPPDGPRLRSLGPVMVDGEGVTAREAGVAAHTTEPEVLVTTIDSDNTGGYTDPITGQGAASAVVGRFYDPRTLAPTSDPFVIVGNPGGGFTRHDVTFNPVSRQYVVVANARTYGAAGRAVPLIALVNPASAAGGGSPVARAFAYREDTEYDFDDVAIAASSKNGNFLLVAEYKFPDEGEGTVGVLFNAAGDVLTSDLTRLDPLQTVGDEDDPDVVYLPGKDAFLYLSNTDNSNNSPGELSNRVVGALVDPAPDAQGKLVTRVEQPLGDGLPEGTAEGHPAAIENPFNGELIVAYDVGGNGVPNGHLAYVNLGTAPAYTFTPARPEVPYLAGTPGNPFNHQHPQLAADPENGVIVVGHNANGSSLGYAEGYAFTLLDVDGAPLPSQLKAPYFLADAPGGLGNSANYHSVRYSPAAGAFVVVFNTTNPANTHLAALQVTSSHLPSGEGPSLAIARSASGVTLSWPASATGYQLQSSPALGAGAAWTAVATPPVTADGMNSVAVTVSGTAQFYRLVRP